MPSESIKTRLVDAINRMLPTVHARLSVVLITVVLAFIAVVLAPRVLPVALAVACLFSLALHFRSRAWLDRRQVLRPVVISARRFRQVFSVGRDVELLHITVLMASFVWLIAALLQNSAEPPISSSWFALVFSLFVLAGIIDAARISMAVRRVAWARWTGKVFYAGVAAFSVWAGGIVSAGLIAQATGLNPEYFVAVGRLVHGLSALLIGLGVIVSVLSLLSLIVYTVVVLGSMLTLHMQTLASAMPRLKPQCEKSSIVYRLVCGKNRLRGASKRIFHWESVLRMMRPAGVLMAGMGILLGLANLQDFLADRLDPVVRGMAVQIEFHSGQKCADRIISEPIKHLGSGEAVIASKVGDDWRFDTFVCESAKKLLK